MALGGSRLFSSETLAAGAIALEAQQVKAETMTEDEKIEAELKDPQVVFHFFWV